MKLLNYPAMASPPSIEIIRKHIGEKLAPNSNILDPFCGTGRLLFSPRVYGHNVTGIDCSPVALLTARVGHQKNNISKINEELALISRLISSNTDCCEASEKEQFWFSNKVYSDLRSILFIIDKVSSTANTRRLFWLALASTIRITSYIRENEYKTHRMKLEDRISFNPIVNDIFIQSCKSIVTKIIKSNESKKGGYRLIQGDIAINTLPKGKFDALITSPPYGDSASTVGYGQFARIPLMILGFSQLFGAEYSLVDEQGSLDKFCLGGSRCLSDKDIEIPKSVQYLTNGPMKKFCNDYFYRLKLATETLKAKSYCCFVLADRTHKMKKFPLIDSTITFMKDSGFDLSHREDRYLTLKRLPRTMHRANNDISTKHEGMNYETVVVFSR